MFYGDRIEELKLTPSLSSGTGTKKGTPIDISVENKDDIGIASQSASDNIVSVVVKKEKRVYKRKVIEVHDDKGSTTSIVTPTIESLVTPVVSNDEEARQLFTSPVRKIRKTSSKPLKATQSVIANESKSIDDAEEVVVKIEKNIVKQNRIHDSVVVTETKLKTKSRSKKSK